MGRVRRIPVDMRVPLPIAPIPAPIRATEKQLLTWVLANGVGHFLAAGALVLFSAFVKIAPIIEGSVAGFWQVTLLALAAAVGVGFIDGLAIGVMQGLILRRYARLPFMHEWVIATVLGGICGWAIGIFVTFITIYSLLCALGILFVPGAIAGAFVGIVQRGIVKRHFGPEVPWVGINIMAGVVASIVGLMVASVPYLASNSGPVSGLAGFAAAGLAYGLVTAGAFGRLVQQHAAR